MPNQTGAAVVDTDDEALTSLLEALAQSEDDEGRAPFNKVITTLAQRTGRTVTPEDRARLQKLLQRDGTIHGYVLPPEADDDDWILTSLGRDHLQSLATEPEEMSSAETEADENVTITQPFNPALIKIDSQQMLAFQVLRKIKLETIILRPEFQRNLVWDSIRKSRLIESILLRIPLPAFYLDATSEDKWQVVDGLQRLSTLDEFYNKKSLRLTGLEYLKDLEGKTFSELPLQLQRVLEDFTQLTVYIIKPETPRYVKFMIFSRVNTGGLSLHAQEIRHAIYQGAATRLLQELAERKEFLTATTGSVNPLRMDDRECVLRFIAFHQNPYQQFGRWRWLREDEPANLDSLLNRTMEDLNNLPVPTLDQLKTTFCDSMIKAQTLFGTYAFRKLYNQGGKRYPISKPLFEVWSVLLVPYAREQLEAYREPIVDGFIDIINNQPDFIKAISLGTGSRSTVNERFSRIESLLAGVLR